MDDEDEIKESKSSQIFCLTWIRKKAAKTNPDKIKLDRSDLKNILKTSKKVKIENEVKKVSQENGDDDFLKEFYLDNYDNDDDHLLDGGLSGLVVFPSNVDDPYISKYESDLDNDSDEGEVEKDAIQVKDDDNLLVCARCEEDYSALEVYVYNHKKKDFYVHHDIPLEVSPLCVHWLDYDAGSVLDQNSVDQGNFIAIGNLDSTIKIWDLDVINTLEPAFVIGCSTNEPEIKSNQNQGGHSDAVMDLSWTSTLRNKLASSSVDHTVVLWDLEKFQVERTFRKHNEKVQAVEWKPSSKSCLLSGAFDGKVMAFDTRSKDCVRWRLKGEIEKLAWDSTNANFFVASTDMGTVYYCDERVPSKALYHWKAHDNDAIPGLAMGPESCLYTGSPDGYVKVWKLGSTEAKLLHEKDMKMGKIYCLQNNPDISGVICAGGERDGARIWNSSKDISEFHSLSLSDHEENQESDKESNIQTEPKQKKIKRRKLCSKLNKQEKRRTILKQRKAKLLQLNS